MDSTNCRSKILGGENIPENSETQNLSLPLIEHNAETTLTKWCVHVPAVTSMHTSVICKYCTILYKGLEHLGVGEAEGVLDQCPVDIEGWLYFTCGRAGSLQQPSRRNRGWKQHWAPNTRGRADPADCLGSGKEGTLRWTLTGARGEQHDLD